MKKVAIIGFGRFGKTLFRLLNGNFAISVYKRKPPTPEEVKEYGIKTFVSSLADIYTNDVIFYAVPISSFENVIASHQKYFRDSHLLIDVLSVKVYPKRIFSKYLRYKKTQAILTHPMFGPDSSKNGFDHLSIVMDSFRSNKAYFQFWKEYFIQKKLTVIEISAREHDRLAAQSQGVTHFIGRLLEQMKFKPTTIDTKGAQKLHEVQQQTCNDTWELFLNLQNYNHFTKSVRIQIGKAYQKLYNVLLPKRVNPRYVIFGIQGGIGSFNEEATFFYTKKNNITPLKIKYLYTTEKVLKNLHEGNIDFGIFAIQNAIGGVVQESTHAMGKYIFTIVDEFVIPIRHFLMKRKDVSEKNIREIMAHPQVFKQCKTTLQKQFPLLILKSGEGNSIDTAKAAEAIASGKIDKNTAILGPGRLAKIYNFDIIASDLQDQERNFTTFFLVTR